jgi:AbrB family looped-hinge helix DNA binding protein
MWHAEPDMAEEPAFVRLRLGPQGRVVVPAHFRRALGLEVGDVLVVSVEEGRLVFEPKAKALASLRALVADAAGDRDLVAELLDERREEVRREAAADAERAG